RLWRSVNRKPMAPSIVSTAEYFEQSARPAHAPAPSHQPHVARCIERSAAIKQAVAPRRPATNGPSGSTHVPVLMPKSGARFNTTAAHSPASAANNADVTRYIIHVVTAKSAMNGARTTSGLSLPARCAAPQANHHETGGWSK